MLEFAYRSTEDEWMDDLEMEGPMLSKTLDQLSKINYWLGGSGPSVNGLARLVKKVPQASYKIVDLGSGAGDTLRAMAKWGRKNNIKLQLTGLDANAHCIRYAQEKSQDFPEINFQQLDCFGKEFFQQEYDIIHCGLFLHHFTDEHLLEYLPRLSQLANTGLVINDLHRSKIAYRLFQLVCTVFRSSDMVRHDGLVSIQRAFTRQDLKQLLPITPLISSELRWQWAFRYQMILDTRAYGQPQ
ncbi:MAG: methyltransferase domain-containing protein [Bacteroidota bacterium]